MDTFHSNLQWIIHTKRLSETRLAILRVVEDADGPLGPTDVADALGQPVNTIKQRIYQMSKDGELRVESRGRYVIGSHNLHNHHNQEDQKVMKVMEVMEEDERLDTNGFLSTDEGNARVQELIDHGMRPDLAAAEVIKRMKEDG